MTQIIHTNRIQNTYHDHVVKQFRCVETHGHVANDSSEHFTFSGIVAVNARIGECGTQLVDLALLLRSHLIGGG